MNLDLPDSEVQRIAAEVREVMRRVFEEVSRESAEMDAAAEERVRERMEQWKRYR